jgi:hypothetical protein
MHIEVKRVIEFYCNHFSISYCQGMLEVVLPFLYLKGAASSDDELSTTYALFKRFVNMYLTNVLHPKFNGKTFVLPYLKCTLYLIDIMLSYTNKELHSHLKRKSVCIETYGAGWVTTLFARTVNFTMLYELWEIFLFERDQYFIFYFAIAILQFYSEKLMKFKTFEKLITMI